MGNYFVFFILPMLFAMWAQWKVKSAYKAASQQRASSGLSGRETALRILQEEGISNVSVEETPGKMSDHYDPKAKVLRLSPDVYQGHSIAALGIAAHEVGHAIQDARSYAPLVIRNGIVPLASVGGNLGMILIFAGFALGALQLAFIGVFLYAAIVVFQLINLPVEFDASKRAKKILSQRAMVSPSEAKIVDNVLDAAAMTYVAATIGAAMTLLYYLVQMGVIGGRRN